MAERNVSKGAPGRNDPCSCGSGLKYKKCCGRPASAALPGRQVTGSRPPLQRHYGRACNGCTACCDGWVKIHVYGHDVYPGKPCPFSTGSGCSIYEHRPVEPCRTFVCGWLADGNPFPDAFRPDRLGVLIQQAHWSGGLFYVLVPAGRDPDDALIGWMDDLMVRTGTPFLYQVQGNWVGRGPEAFLREIVEQRKRGMPLIAPGTGGPPA